MHKNWYRLDTAALIFPSIARRDWCNVFRFSATLNEPVDPDVLQRALNDMTTRFPSFFVSLKKGFFWYYLDKSRKEVKVRPDFAYPLTFMGRGELRENCLRVFYYKNRIAAEFFHSLSDGRGGSVFLCSLVARYLELKHGIEIERGDFIKDLTVAPPPGELEDSFLKHAAPVAAKRDSERSFRLHGSSEKDGFRTLTTGICSTKDLLDASHRYGVSVTAFLSAVMIESIIGMQDEEVPKKKQKAVKVTIPVDLRKLFGSVTMRNFALALNIGVDPKFGEYTLDALCRSVYHQLNAEATPQNMAGMIAANVFPQQNTLIRLCPVFLKTIVMDAVYRRSGECGGSLNISNLANVTLPENMAKYVERLEFIIGPQRSYPNNCSVSSYGGKTYINMIRSIREAELERRFFSRLVDLGIAIDIESNRR